MKAIYAVLLSFITFYSCEKGFRETTVEGVVVDLKTGKPIPYAEVGLIRSGGGGGDFILGSSGTSSEGLYKTDENGKFAFGFNTDNKSTYYVSASKAEYINVNESEVRLKNLRKNKDIKVKLCPASWFKIHITDKIPLGEVRLFSISQHSLYPSVTIQNPRDTTFIIKIYSQHNIDTFPYWLYFHNEVDYKHFIYTAECKSLDTTDVYIKF